jgi:hydroxypyruvate reductase
MASTAVRLLGARILSGLVVGIAADGPPVERWAIDAMPRLESIFGGHPLPTDESERAGRRALEIADALRHDEALVVLLSGGASALLAVPAAGLCVDDKRTATEELLRAGADITALNAVRKHLSAIKGGRLAARAKGDCRTFAVSDVVGDDLSVIASGPTVADATTFSDALDVVRQYSRSASFPPGVVAHLERGARGELPETPKPGDARLRRSRSKVVGGRRDAMDGAAREARARGYHVLWVEDPVVGEARVAAVAHLRGALARVADQPRPMCVVSSGETTVRVEGRGRGGRNQEFALALAAPLALLGVPAAAASVGTDGIDGPTPAAGALVDWTTLRRAAAAGIGEPSRFLNDNDAYRFHAAVGDLVQTGPTGTNVGDLQIVLLA